MMHTYRITNATVFITVLSACLGLVVVGAPHEVRAQRQTEAAQSERAAAPEMHISDSVSLGMKWLFGHRQSSSRSGEIAAAPVSFFHAPVDRNPCAQAVSFYSNSVPLVQNQQFLITTRLPRAGLVAFPA